MVSEDAWCPLGISLRRVGDRPNGCEFYGFLGFISVSTGDAGWKTGEPRLEVRIPTLPEHHAAREKLQCASVCCSLLGSSCLLLPVVECRARAGRLLSAAPCSRARARLFCLL